MYSSTNDTYETSTSVIVTVQLREIPVIPFFKRKPKKQNERTEKNAHIEIYFIIKIIYDPLLPAAYIRPTVRFILFDM